MTQYNAQSNGFVEDIFLSTKLNTVSIGNSIRVNGEHMTVLNNFRNGVLKVKDMVLLVLHIPLAVELIY